MIVYQALVHAFKDTKGQGVGTLAGVTEKLDYLAWLGVDCLWLPPFYASPMKDDGYDIADYYSINPLYGTMEDLEQLLADAHSRGIKVICDLALNHTSADHEWFQKSRQRIAPYTDYYVWGDDPNRYPEIRIIFSDVETSNWSFDSERGQYYFHRFYSHQPDLNYDCPEVHEEVFKIIRFWMDKGLDGFRLDAIPYLYERDGLGGESLPETIAFIGEIRALLDAEYPHAVMLAEANQPVDETMDFFDSFHWVFNFPLMPQLYQAMATGNAAEIDFVAPPASSSARRLAGAEEAAAVIQPAAWANFLRNHDELTLEMVSDDVRELMYATYLPDNTARANLGIARRLMPLMGGDRRKVELLYAVLLALPGVAFLYYGDEIGMNDDISLPDRYAVRTPMQWESGPGAGFTTGTPRWPIVGGTSVAEQMADPDSLLHAIRAMIARSKEFRDLTDFSRVESAPEIFAFRRGNVLCRHNFSDSEVDGLAPYAWEWVDFFVS